MQVAQDIIQRKLHYILHRSLVDIRNAALAKDHEKAYLLADAFEIIPTLMASWEMVNLDRVREILDGLRPKYPNLANDYLAILEMADDRFLAMYDSPGGYE